MFFYCTVYILYKCNKVSSLHKEDKRVSCNARQKAVKFFHLTEIALTEIATDSFTGYYSHFQLCNRASSSIFVPNSEFRSLTDVNVFLIQPIRTPVNNSDANVLSIFVME